VTTATKELLSLAEAAERLNVHPATLRRWADKGDVLVMVTPGGHRRFPTSEIERLRNASKGEPAGAEAVFGARWANHAISHARHELAEHPDKPWLTEIDDDEREKKRQMGREMIGLLRTYVTGDQDDPDVLDRAREIGRSYVAGTKDGGSSLSESLDATTFFRDSILESTMLLPEVVRLDPETNRRYLRRVNRFMNCILLAVAEAYEQ
jgi:excisionase family DNA binding protein